MPDDQTALFTSVRICAEPAADARMVFIRDTLSLEDFYVSPNMRAIVEAHPRLSVVAEVPLSFENGEMTSPWVMEAEKVYA